MDIRLKTVLAESILNKGLEGLADHFLSSPSKDAFSPAVHEPDDPLRIGKEQGIRGEFDQALELAFGLLEIRGSGGDLLLEKNRLFAQGVVGLPEFRDVALDRHVVDQPVMIVEQGLDLDAGPILRTVLAIVQNVDQTAFASMQ